MSREFDLGQWLQNTLIFRSLEAPQLIPVIEIARCITLGKGEILFKQDTEVTGFFIVKSGRMKVFRLSSAGKEQILNIFEAGENFAEVAVLDGKPFPASAAALEPTELVFFPRQAFLELLRRYPDIAVNMLISLSRHLRHLTHVIHELSFKDVPQRLATYLLKLRMAQAEESPGSSQGPVVQLNLTKSQLAAALGTIPSTLSRAFYYLSNEGLIAVNGSQIELLDRDRLQTLSQVAQQDDQPPVP